MNFKPKLTDPGNQKYWEISIDRIGYFVLTLRNQFGTKLVEDDLPPDEAGTDEIERLSRQLLVRHAREQAFVGTYKFEEKK